MTYSPSSKSFGSDITSKAALDVGMGYTRSPLRYPGGKSRLPPVLRALMKNNGLLGSAYAEPFAGAAGVAWALLFDGSASHVYLNDIDPAIYSFWDSVLNH